MFKAIHQRRAINLFIILALLLSFSISVYAQDGIDADPATSLEEASSFYADANKEDAAGRSPASELVSVIVKLDFDPLATYRGDVEGLAATSPLLTGTTKLDTQSSDTKAYLAYVDSRLNAFEATLTQAIPEAKVVHRYRAVIGGASLLVPENRVEALASLGGVRAIYADEVLQVETEASPAFIGAPTAWGQLGGQGSAGEGVVVGVLDTGVWPEHPSFSDPDPFGKAYDPPPGGPYTCDFGDTTFNPNDAAFTCNNKLIGAYDFLNTYKAVIGLLPDEFDSARDADGHGTHTSTTAAGNGGVAATMLGVNRGLVSGIAPRAHVIMYKVCGDQGCFSSDSAAAVDQAVMDGVDVTNFSISGGNDPYSDVVELAFLNAYAAGVFAAHSAGNSGPGADTVAHRGPWVTTVGASTTDRHFLSTVTLTGIVSGTTSVTATLMISGASVTDGIITPTLVVSAADFGDELCLNPFTSGTFNGEIVVCKRGAIARVEKSFNVEQGGAGGLLLYNPVLQGLATDNHFIPSVHLENDSGVALLDFMDNHTEVKATFTPGVATTVQGDKMAAFSSRGGPGQTLGVSKPDITAPGVQILVNSSSPSRALPCRARTSLASALY